MQVFGLGYSGRSCFQTQPEGSENRVQDRSNIVRFYVGFRVLVSGFGLHVQWSISVLSTSTMTASPKAVNFQA